MEFFYARFPTKTLRRRELRLEHLVRAELEWWRANDHRKQTGFLWSRLLRFAAAFRDLYAQWQREALKQHPGSISCRAGCRNCCHHYPQSVEPFESLALYVELRQREDFAAIMAACWRCVERFQALKDKIRPESEDEEDRVLQEYFALRIPCPFLDQSGSCGVYAHRPVTCRMYFSETDPRFCTAEYLLTEANRSFHVCLPDLLEEDLAELGERTNLRLSHSLYEAMLELNARECEGWFDATESV